MKSDVGVILCVYVTNDSDSQFYNFNEEVNYTGLFYGHADPISSSFNLLFCVCTSFGETVRCIATISNLPLSLSSYIFIFSQKSFSFKYSREIN
jgi:hypothetical protein